MSVPHSQAGGANRALYGSHYHSVLGVLPRAITRNTMRHGAYGYGSPAAWNAEQVTKRASRPDPEQKNSLQFQNV